MKKKTPNTGQIVDNLAVSTPDHKWKPNPKLTRKRNNYVKYLVNNPKSSGTEAVLASFDVTKREVAAEMAAQLKRNPLVASELAKYEATAEYNLIKLANVTTDYAMAGGKDGAAYASVAERVNNSIVDRLKGKATQVIQQNSNAVQINISLQA
jgi:hypothetical protein